MEHKTNSKQIILYTILLIAIIVMGILFNSGCAAFKDAKRYEMRPSPCACDDELFIA